MTEETLIAVEVNAQTGEVTERPFTPEEVEAYNKVQQDFLARESAKEQAEAVKAALKESAKAKLIAGEPLTEEEANVLVI